MEVAYGSTDHAEVIDDNGSTRTSQQKYLNSELQKPVRIRYNIRHRTDKTDIETIARIAHALLGDSTKLDAELKLERTNRGEKDGYFNLVECYTILEY